MNLSRVDLNLLLAFEALWNAKNVSLAARSLGLRQPAMSSALARLRKLFGDEVFVRVGGEMRPSPKSLRLAPGLFAALAQLRATLGEEAAFDPATVTITFTLALTDYCSAIVLPGLAAIVRDHAPGVDLRVVGYEKDDVEALIERGVADLAVGVFPRPPAGLVVKPLVEEEFVGVARAGHPALGGAMTVERYARLDHALFTVSRDATGAIDVALAALGLRRRVALTVPHFLSLPLTLSGSDLVAALPLRLVRQMNDPRLATFAIPLALPPWRVDVLWNPLARSDKASIWLRGAVSRACMRLDDTAA